MVAAEHGGAVPAYATAGPGGTPVDVDPGGPSRPSRRITSPDDPNRQVSREEFDEMVRDLHAEDPPARTAVQEPPPPAPAPAPARDGGAVRAPDADPDDLYLKDGTARDKTRKPRNRKHGRPR
jgi:SecD/SecF fusion protein